MCLWRGGGRLEGLVGRGSRGGRGGWVLARSMVEDVLLLALVARVGNEEVTVWRGRNATVEPPLMVVV